MLSFPNKKKPSLQIHSTLSFLWNEISVIVYHQSEGATSERYLIYLQWISNSVHVSAEKLYFSLDFIHARVEQTRKTNEFSFCQKTHDGRTIVRKTGSECKAEIILWKRIWCWQIWHIPLFTWVHNYVSAEIMMFRI